MKCSATGLTVPECSCGACLEGLIRDHSPGLLERPASAEPLLELPPLEPPELDELAA